MKTNNTPRGRQKGISEAKSTPEGGDSTKRELLPWYLKKQSAHIKIHGGLLEYTRRYKEEHSESIAIQIEKGLMLYHGLKEIPVLTPEGGDKK